MKIFNSQIFVRTIAVLLSITTICIAAVFGISYYVGRELIGRKSISTFASKIDLCSYKTTEVTFKSSNEDLNLCGTLVTNGQPSNKTIILLHGYTDDRYMKGYLQILSDYFVKNKNFNIFSFDLRARGRSEGNATTVGYREKYDVMGAIDYLKSQTIIGEKIVLFGFSMGAATALETLSKEYRVDFTIADSPYRDLSLYLSENLSYWSGLPNFPFNKSIPFVVSNVFKIDTHAVSAIRNLKEIDKPVLLIHGKDDIAVPYTNSVEIFNAMENNSKKDLWLTENTQHIQSILVYKDEYLEKVNSFINKNLE